MAAIIMSALQVAGFLIASQIGLSYAQTIDPTQNTQGAVVGNFMTLLGVVAIFATDMHHLAIGAIAGSYRLLPPGGHLPTCDMAQLVIQLVSGSFALGFQLAAPFLVFGFAVYAGLGLLARLMPQLQIFFRRRADQHSLRLSHHAGAAGFDDHRLPELLLHVDGGLSVSACRKSVKRFFAASATKVKQWLTIATTPRPPNSRQRSAWNRRANPATSSNRRKSPPLCCWRAARWPSPCSASSTAIGIAQLLTVFLEQPDQISVDGAGLAAMLRGTLLRLALVLAPFVGVMVAAALAGHVLQSRPSFTPSRLVPDFSKLSPLAGFGASSAWKAG